MVAQPNDETSAWSPEPDLATIDADGAPLQLASLWAEQPLLLVFLPPWDSPFCFDNAAHLRDNGDLLDDSGVCVAAVCDVGLADARRFVDERNIRYPLLCDADGALRTAFSVEHHASPTAGGRATFIIDTSGRVRFEHRGGEPDDYPMVWTLVREACAVTGARVEAPPPPERTPIAPSLAAGPRAECSPFIGGGAHRALRAGYSCTKCGFAEYDVSSISTAGGIWSRLFNFQHRKFTAVTCRRCTFTELYKTDASALANIFDFLASG